MDIGIAIDSAERLSEIGMAKVLCDLFRSCTFAGESFRQIVYCHDSYTDSGNGSFAVSEWHIFKANG